MATLNEIAEAVSVRLQAAIERERKASEAFDASLKNSHLVSLQAAMDEFRAMSAVNFWRKCDSVMQDLNNKPADCFRILLVTANSALIDAFPPVYQVADKLGEADEIRAYCWRTAQGLQAADLVGSILPMFEIN